MLKINDYIYPTDLLGPYNRFVLWVDGCCFSCPGCILENNNLRNRVEMSADEMSRVILNADNIEGITISGGEPFLQAAELSEMLIKVKKERDIGVIIYTGFTLDELMEKETPAISALLGMTDILIDGRYIRELDDGAAYRGSSNQRIIMLSDRYNNIYDEYYCSGSKRRSKVLWGQDKVMIVGVPDKEDLSNWILLKKELIGLGEFLNAD